MKIRLIFYKIFFILMGFGALLFTLLSTQGGARFVFQSIQLFSHGTLVIESIQGTLIKGFHFKGVQFFFPTMEGDIEQIDVEFSFVQLIEHLELNFTELKLENLVIYLKPSQETNKKTFIFPPLPSIAINNFLLKNMVVHHQQDVYQVDSIGASVFFNQDELNLPILQIATPKGYFYLNGKTDFKAFKSLELNAKGLYKIEDVPMAVNGVVKISRNRNEPIVLSINGMSQDANMPYQIKIEASGNLNEHQLSLTTLLPQGKINAHFKGALSETNWIGKIDKMEIDSAHYGKIKLLSNSLLSIDKKQLQLEESCIQVEGLKGCLKGSVEFADAWPQSKLNFDATVDDHHFADLKTWIEVPGLDGPLHGAIQLQGTISNPKWYLKAFLTDGQYDIPDLAAHIVKVKGTFETEENLNYRIKAEGLLDNETVFLESNGNFHHDDVNLHFKGTKLKLKQTDEMTIWGDPDLFLQIFSDKMNITGNIVVTKANIHLKERPRAQYVSADTIMLNLNPAEKPKTTFPIFLGLTLDLKDNIQFQGYGLFTHAKGKVALEGSQDDLRGTGEIQLHDGYYEAFKRKLIIKEGRLQFNKSILENPSIVFRAERTIPADDNDQALKGAENINAGISVTGTYKNPNMRLYSDPAMPQNDIISYFLFNRRLNAASAAEGQAVITATEEAANFLGFQHGDMIAEIKSKLGLDELGFEMGAQTAEMEQDNKPNVAVSIGKQVTERLRVGYSYGLVDALSTFKVRFRVSDKIRLEASTNAKGSGGDVIYHIEKN